MTRRENDSLEQSGNHGSLFSRENLLRRTLLFSDSPAYPLGKGKGWMEGAYDQLHSLRKSFLRKDCPLAALEGRNTFSTSIVEKDKN